MRASTTVLGLMALQLAAGCPNFGTPQAASSSSSGTSSGGSSGVGSSSASATSEGTHTCTDGGPPEWATWTPPPDQPTGYVVDVDTVTDLATGLIWQRDFPREDGGFVSTAVGLTWSEATTYCATLSLAGSTEWRLPTLIELSSLVDSSATSPAINGAAFPMVLFDKFWTSSAYAGAPAAWVVGFSEGQTAGENVGNHGAVRCVR